jgi:hypothetical protein
MTTFRKLPTTSPSNTAPTTNSQGAALKTATIVIAGDGERRKARGGVCWAGVDYASLLTPDASPSLTPPDPS